MGPVMKAKAAKNKKPTEPKKPRQPRIQKEMRVAEILALLPESESLLARYGLSCFHCSSNAFETLDEGCRSHGFTDEDIGDLVTDLNELLKDRPERPQTLTVTLPAARALLDIAETEKKTGQSLLVGVDEAGGFCMEFQKKASAGTKVFFNTEAPAMKLYATSLTLQRIGGAVIDFREGRFKLDLADAAKGACGCGKGECGCK